MGCSSCESVTPFIGKFINECAKALFAYVRAQTSNHAEKCSEKEKKSFAVLEVDSY